MGREHVGEEQSSDAGPIDDLFDFDEDQVDFMSAGSFPASDPPPPPSAVAPSEPPQQE